MQLKPLIIYCCLFLIQMGFSCVPCDCNEKSYVVEFHNMDLTALDLSGFQATEVKDTVYRNAFGLVVAMSAHAQEVSDNGINFGFSSAMACDCGPDNYDYIDPVQTAEIYMTDEITGQIFNASTFFNIWEYAGNLTSIPDFFAEKRQDQEYFQFQLTAYDSVPESATFMVELTLVSGTQFTEQTQTIHFYD